MSNSASNGALERFNRYPKIVLAAYLAQRAEQEGSHVANDLAELAAYHDELRRKYPRADYELGDEAPECGVGKEDAEEADERT